MNPPASVTSGLAASARPARRRFAAAGWGASLVALVLVPKCALCILAWLAALAGLGVELCGSGPSWALLAAGAARRLGLPAAALAALGALLLATGAFVSWKLVARFTRRSR